MPNVLSQRDLVSRPDNMAETVLHTSRSSRYLEVELKASIMSYRFFLCERLHETEIEQISFKGTHLVPIGIPTFCL